METPHRQIHPSPIHDPAPLLHPSAPPLGSPDITAQLGAIAGPVPDKAANKAMSWKAKAAAGWYVSKFLPASPLAGDGPYYEPAKILRLAFFFPFLSRYRGNAQRALPGRLVVDR